MISGDDYADLAYFEVDEYGSVVMGPHTACCLGGINPRKRQSMLNQSPTPSLMHQ